MSEQPRESGRPGAGRQPAREQGAGRQPAAERRVGRPTVETAGIEMEHPASSARLPGAARYGYTKLPTGPIGVEPVVATGPDADSVGAPKWDPEAVATGAQPVEDTTRLAPWALVAAIVALVASFFVGWGIPLAIVAVVASIMSLRRPVESRSIARWALVLGLVATVYSLGWLIWAAMQFEKLG